MYKRFRFLTLTGSLVGLLSLAGCLNESLQPGPGEPPPPCTESTFCRLQNPSDTIHLSSPQKAKVLAWFETMRDSADFALTTIDLYSLDSDTLTIKLMKDLNVTIDSIGFRTTDTLTNDSVTIVDWRGYVKAPYTGFVDLTFHNNEFESGFAVINDKYLTLLPLGGSKALVMDDPSPIWMGECPAAKTAATQLTCVAHVTP